VEYEKRVKQVEELVEKIEWNDIDSDDLTRFLKQIYFHLFADTSLSFIQMQQYRRATIFAVLHFVSMHFSGVNTRRFSPKYILISF